MLRWLGGAGHFPPPVAADVFAAAGDQVDVDIEADREPREVEAPADLIEALAQDQAAQAEFDRLSFTHRPTRRLAHQRRRCDNHAVRCASL